MPKYLNSLISSRKGKIYHDIGVRLGLNPINHDHVTYDRFLLDNNEFKGIKLEEVNGNLITLIHHPNRSNITSYLLAVGLKNMYNIPIYILVDGLDAWDDFLQIESIIKWTEYKRTKEMIISIHRMNDVLKRYNNRNNSFMTSMFIGVPSHDNTFINMMFDNQLCNEMHNFDFINDDFCKFVKSDSFRNVVKTYQPMVDIIVRSLDINPNK